MSSPKLETKGAGTEVGKKRKALWFVCVRGLSARHVKEEGATNPENESCEGGKEDSNT